MPFIIKEHLKLISTTIEFSMMPDKTYHLSEFIYTFQKMGVSVVPPVIKGIDDYKGA